MTNEELIAELQKLPPKAEVRYVWDSEDRSSVDFVWLAKNGIIVLSYAGELIFNQSAWPHDYVKSEEEYYYQVPLKYKDKALYDPMSPDITFEPVEVDWKDYEDKIRQSLPDGVKLESLKISTRPGEFVHSSRIEIVNSLGETIKDYKL